MEMKLKYYTSVIFVSTSITIVLSINEVFGGLLLYLIKGSLSTGTTNLGPSPPTSDIEIVTSPSWFGVKDISKKN
jgi:hypothetical protein